MERNNGISLYKLRLMQGTEGNGMKKEMVNYKL